MIVLAAIWGATQWTAWRLGYQPQLGTPWTEIAGTPVYPPPVFFLSWYWFDAYAPRIFIEGAIIASSGGFAAIAIAIGMSVWRAREAKEATCPSRESYPRVSMMQAGQDWRGDNGPRSLDGSS
jgi:type IV secretion system protein VirD4